MHRIYMKRLLTGLIALLLVFALIAFMSLSALRKGQPLFFTGMNYAVQNVIILVFSILSMLKVLWEIIKLEMS